MIGRRLVSLEAALPPKEAVVLWLTEAQAFASLPAYVAWLVDQPEQAHPLVRLPAQVEAATRRALRGQDHDTLHRAMRQAVGWACFLFCLVVRVNLATEEIVRIEGLRLAALTFWMRELALRAELAMVERPPPDPSADPFSDGWRRWRETVAAARVRLRGHDEARAMLEQRHLDGHAVLFADLATELPELLNRAERLAAIGDGPGDRDMVLSQSESEQAEVTTLASAIASRLADVARCEALDLLGETDAALAIAGRRLRAG